MEHCGIIKKSNTEWHFPLPSFESIIEALSESEAKFFSSLDLSHGFYQIPLHKETAHKTGFITHKGIWEFTRLLFGLMNAP